MAVPATTGRTVWLNASDNDKLYEAYGPPGSDTPEADDPVQSWDDEDSAANIYMIYLLGTTNPLFRTSGMNSIGALEFDGSNDRMRSWNDAVSALQGLGNYISTSAYTLFVAFRSMAAATNNANMYDNTAILSQYAYGAFGLHLKSNGGSHTVHAYNNDGNQDEVSKAISLNTNHVVMVRHESGNLYISLDGGSESSVASGNTSLPADGPLFIGSNYDETDFFNGRIGEILMYNAALTGSDLTDTTTYMTDKWLGAAAPALRTLNRIERKVMRGIGRGIYRGTS